MDKLKLLLVAILLSVFGGWLFSQLGNHDALINWNDVHQIVDGFGASSASDMPELNALTDARADMFFDPVKGIGLSLLRTQIQPDGSSLEIVTAQKAVARGARVWATPWTPPANFKSNGNLENGGYLLHSHFGAWATVLAGYARMMRAKDVPIYAVSVQNEPDIAPNYVSCLYTAQDLHEFVPYLYSALQTADVRDTKIMVGEQSEWAIHLTEKAMADPKTASQVDIIAAHDYGRRKIRPFNTGRSHLWETEVTGGSGAGKFNASISDGLVWASNIHEFLTVANVNAWHWWALMTDEDDNGGLTDKNGNPAKRMYVIGQWSRFVRPGWLRIGVSYAGPLQISAFKDPVSQSFAIVAINKSAKSSIQKFSLSEISTDSVTPWTTSADLSLSRQTPVSVNGKTFSYALPALSVTTFTGARQATN